MIYANKLGPEQPYIVYGRWTNMSYTPLAETAYPGYVPNWGATGSTTTTRKSTTKTTTTTTTTTIKTTKAAVPTTLAVTSTKEAATGTLTQVTPTTPSSAASLRITGALGLLIALVAAILL
jgi:carbohydrate-binding DOMON domain-containing protein